MAVKGGPEDVLNDLESAFSTNFKADIEAIATAVGETLNSEFNLYIDEHAETIKGKPLPGLGIRVLPSGADVNTQAKRDYKSIVRFDYVARGEDRRVLGRQVRRAAQAILRRLDKIEGTGSVMKAVRAEFGSRVIVDLADLLVAKSSGDTSGLLLGGVRVQAEVVHRDEVGL